MDDTVVFFVVMISIAYAIIGTLAMLRGHERQVIYHLKGGKLKIEALITIIKILGIPLIVSMLLALPDLVIPLSRNFEICKECNTEAKKFLPEEFHKKIDSPNSCRRCKEIDLKDTPPGYVFVVAMIVIFITLELAQLDSIRGGVREAWSSLLLFSLLIDFSASAIFIVVKYNQYNNLLFVYLIAILAFLASFLVIFLSRIDGQIPVEDSTHE